jgi:hypothetical protein
VIGLTYELTGRSSAYPVPGHLLIKGTHADYYLFVRVARKKTQVTTIGQPIYCTRDPIPHWSP